MKTTFIYALKCPTTGLVRYVGKTNNPRQRFSKHIFKADKEDTHRARWIRSLRPLSPVLEVLDEVPEDYWPQWEVAYIAFFREEGCDLVNANAGGEGSHNPTPEARANMRKAHLGHVISEEARLKLRAANSGKNNRLFGKKLPAETILKRSAARLGKKLKNNTSGFVGVCWHKTSKQWRADIASPRIYLGAFKKIEDAVFVRALAVDKVFSGLQCPASA